MYPQNDLDLLKGLNDIETCSYLAAKVRKIRLDLINESQEAFAKRAGIPLRTYKRFENGGKATLSTFIKVLKGIDRSHYLFLLFPAPAPEKKPSLQEHINELASKQALLDETLSGGIVEK